jgi:ribosome-binding ATPase
VKIGFIGFDLKEGKIKYEDERFKNLVEKFEPQKETPFSVEFVKGEMLDVDAILIKYEKLLDLLIQDIEKIEGRLAKTQDDKEKALLLKCQEALEMEQPLCNIPFDAEETAIMRGLAPLSWKPTYVAAKDEDINLFIQQVLHKARVHFFYTVGKKEVHAWQFTEGSTIVDCAGEIHTDLARGFIRADIISYEDMLNCHNLQEAKTKGLVKTVTKEYLTRDGDIIEIKFNV